MIVCKSGNDSRVAVALILMLSALALACVGSERADESAGQRIQAGREPAAGGGGRGPVVAYRDTIAPVDYRIFETVPESERPKKALYRIVVLGRASEEALGKTVRVALDSIAQADTSLAAARAVLYVVLRTSRTEGRLVPRVWGEWIPPEGWEKAAARSGRRVYRSYVYHGDPGWAGDSEG